MTQRQQTLSQNAPSGEWQARWLTIKGSPRAILLGLLIACIFGVFSWRLWYLQIVQGEYYRKQSDIQRLATVAIPASRGIIYDRAGTPLVRNIPSFKVAVIPANLPDDEGEAEAVLIRLSILLNMPYTTAGLDLGEDGPPPGLRDKVRNALCCDQFGDEWPFSVYHRPVVVKRSVDRDAALLIAQENLALPGVLVDVDSRRDYPYGSLVSQALGYLMPIPGGNEAEYKEKGYDPDTDRIGVQGVEAVYEDALRGQKGEHLVEEDVLGRTIRVVEERVAPVPGGNVYLTLDLDLQRFVEEALRRGLANANSPRGVALVMNPQTGEIMAMVSLPAYDNNLFTQGISVEDWQRLNDDDHRPLLNHAITDGLPPGSVFKIVMAAAALQEGVLEPDTRLTCPGTIILPNKYYPNDPGRDTRFYCWIWRQGSHGSLDVVGGLAQSCDIFFYKVGGGFEEDDFEGLGVARIARYAEMFGFGARSGVELMGEIAGTVPDATWKRLTHGESWSTGDTYNLSIGQGYLVVTPLQMLNAINVVANGGRLLRPRIVHHVTDAEGSVTQPFAPDLITHTLPISLENWSLVQQGMEGAVVYGTAARAQVEGVRVAGKTGTAQFCDDIMCGTGGYDMPEHAWFAAFAPVERPEVSVLVFLYNGGEGSQKAAPVAQEILEHYFSRDELPSE